MVPATTNSFTILPPSLDTYDCITYDWGMNSFKRIVLAALLAAGMVLTMTGTSDAATVRPKTCAKQWLHPWSDTARACRRAGWTIEGGHFVELDGRLVYWGLVVGPKGKVYRDTFHQWGSIR